MEYLWRYFVVGLLPIILIGLVLGAAFGFLLVAHVLSLAVVLPGSVVVNFFAARRRRWRHRRRDPKRPREAAFLSVAIFWIGLPVMAAIPLEPIDLLVRFLGQGGAYGLHFFSWLIVASALGQIVAWAQASRPPQASPEKPG